MSASVTENVPPRSCKHHSVHLLRRVWSMESGQDQSVDHIMTKKPFSAVWTKRGDTVIITVHTIILANFTRSHFRLSLLFRNGWISRCASIVQIDPSDDLSMCPALFKSISPMNLSLCQHCSNWCDWWISLCASIVQIDTTVQLQAAD